ncbi:MAG: hypothetical protein FD171_858 [Actinobacteria bacterium]|nr:MAG: hypothetical protein FD171_858 [Actinomycetota bacterium]
MPVITRFTLAGPRPADPANHAKAIRALVLAWIASGSPDVARASHDLGGLKPYSIGPLTRISSTNLWTFDVRFVDDRLEPMVVHGAGAVGTSKRLGADTYQLALEPQEIRRASWEQIIRSARACALWRIRFETPTAHRTGTSSRVVRPVPDIQVYGRGWLARWKGFAPVPLPDGVDLAVEALAITAQMGRTADVALDPGRSVTGFVGTIDLEMGHPEHQAPEVLSAIDALLTLAEFGGTGMETMRGMGVTVRARAWDAIPLVASGRLRGGGWRRNRDV